MLYIIYLSLFLCSDDTTPAFSSFLRYGFASACFLNILCRPIWNLISYVLAAWHNTYIPSCLPMQLCNIKQVEFFAHTGHISIPLPHCPKLCSNLSCCHQRWSSLHHHFSRRYNSVFLFSTCLCYSNTIIFHAPASWFLPLFKLCLVLDLTYACSTF